MTFRLHPAIYANASGGGRALQTANFWWPANDAGAGAVDLTLARGVGLATFTRATSATCWGSSGLLLTVGSGVARSTYTELTGASYLGYLAEEARTNEVLWNRDLTNAAWTKVSTTAAKDQVGIDGAANSASSLTATGANATTLQIITEAAANRTFSAYVKRITGTGEIDITEDGGLTWTNVTSQITSATYTRVSATQSVLNPSVGFRIVTSGDKIAMDYVQNEAGTFVTSPIATTTAAVVRNRDDLRFPLNGNLTGTVGTAYCEGRAGPAISGRFVDISAGGFPMGRSSGNGINLALYDVTATRVIGTLPSGAFSVTKKLAASWGGATCAGAVDGVLTSGVAFDGDLNVGTDIIIGGAATVEINGTIKNVRLWTRALADSQLVSLTS